MIISIPESPNITKTHLYQTFDVTEYIHSGQNALGALLSEGWWSGGATFTGDNWNFFGDRQSLLAKLVITYADGQEKVVITNPSTWHITIEVLSVMVASFKGEVYDALRDARVKGWSTASYNAVDWKPACEVAWKATSVWEGNPDKPRVSDYSRL